MFPDDLNEQQRIRREKADELRQLGVDPFGSRYERTHSTQQIIDEFSSFDHDALEAKHQFVSIAGRIVLKREQGKAGFMQIQDRDNKLQVYVRLDHVGEFSFDLFKKADLGDIVGVKGFLFRTKTNE